MWREYTDPPIHRQQHWLSPKRKVLAAKLRTKRQFWNTHLAGWTHTHREKKPEGSFLHLLDDAKGLREVVRRAECDVLHLDGDRVTPGLEPRQRDGLADRVVALHSLERLDVGHRRRAAFLHRRAVSSLSFDANLHRDLRLARGRIRAGIAHFDEIPELVGAAERQVALRNDFDSTESERIG